MGFRNNLQAARLPRHRWTKADVPEPGLTRNIQVDIPEYTHLEEVRRGPKIALEILAGFTQILDGPDRTVLANSGSDLIHQLRR